MLLSVALLAGALLVYFDLIQPVYGDLQTKKGKQLSSQDFLISEQTVVSQAKKLISQYDSASQAQGSLGLAMPSGPDIAGALAQIYGIAQNNAFTVKSINISPPVIRPQSAQPSGGGAGAGSQLVKPMGSIMFQLSAIGSYENLKNFVSQLEANIRIFDLTSLSIQSAAPAAATGKVNTNQDLFTYSLTAITYYQLP